MADYQLFVDTATNVLKGHFPTQDVFKLLISKLLGYCILAGACITKLPQILAVTNSGSATGLSPLSIELETFGLLVHAAYGYVSALPFSMYGEVAILAVQNFVLLGLVYSYGKQPFVRSASVFTLLAGLVTAVLNGSVPAPWVHRAFDANNAVLIASRVPQIVANQRDRSTGQLSVITACINLLGVCVRIFTTLSEGGGAAMLRSYLISLLLNATLVAQIFLFAKGTKRGQSKKDKVKKVE